MNLKFVLATALAATFVVLGGCGGGDSPADTQQDEDEIAALLEDINAATQDRDALDFCGLMQPSGVTEVFNTQSQCVRETAQILKQAPGTQPQLMAESIEVDGDKATVELADDAGGAPIEVVKEGGKWYVPLNSENSPGATSGSTDG